jgi:signal transduction histidine kinase
MDLWDAIEVGLILVMERVHSAVEIAAAGVGTRCRFAHDRIQQAVLSSVDAERLARLHRNVGRCLLSHATAEGLAGIDRWLFDITDHLNLGQPALSEQAERDELVGLDLQAARKALKAGAAQPALGYAQAGLSILGEDDWGRCYEAVRDLHVIGAEAAFLSGDLAAFDALSRAALGHAREVLDEVRVRNIEGQFYNAQQRPREAVRTYLEMLRRLGFDLPDEPTAMDIGTEMARTAQEIGDRRAADLLALPVCMEPVAAAALEILNQLIPIAGATVSTLMPVAVCRLVQASLRHGNTADSSIGYVFYGILLHGSDPERAYDFGRLAVELADRFKHKALLAQTLVYAYCHLIHLKAPLAELVPAFADAYRYGMEAAVPFPAAGSALTLCLCRFIAGDELPALAADMASYAGVIRQIRETLVLSWHQIYQQAVHNLLEETPDPGVLDGPLFIEAQRVPAQREAGDGGGMFNYHYCKTLLCCLFGQYISAAESAVACAPYFAVAATSMSAAPWTFWEALSRLAAYQQATDQERKETLKAVDTGLQRLRAWLPHCPQSYAHKIRIIEAERHRVLGEPEEAAAAFREGVELARRSGILPEEAAADERAAYFHLSRGDRATARAYLREAHRTYLRWGAVAKVRALERQHPDLLPRVATAGSDLWIAVRAQELTVLDLVGVLDASQAISQEIRLDRLLLRLMDLLLSTSGAEVGSLLLLREGRWVVDVARSAGGATTVLQSIPIEELAARGQRGVPAAVVYYVARTSEAVVLDDAAESPDFGHDPYIAEHQVRSVLCFPLVRQNDTVGIVYLENSLARGVFTPDRISVLRMLSAQTVISLQNALLYETLEQKVADRTRELQQRNADLADTLRKLRETQQQLVTQEKLASLGALTAGIAHEIRNPLNFVNNFADLSRGLAEGIGETLQEHWARFPDPARQALSEDLADLRQNMTRIAEHGRRANGIVTAMLFHARDSGGEREEADLNALVAESVALGQHGAGAPEPGPPLLVQAHYDAAIGPLWIAAPDVSRALINIVNNACYALREKARGAGPDWVPTLTVTTRDLGERAEVRIRDNGPGIAASEREKIFNPFYTTKPPGSGVGLGLSISQDILVDAHQGELRVDSVEGEWTEFAIVLPKGSPPG